MGVLLRDVKVTVGMETVEGTPVDRTAVLPAAGKVDLDNTPVLKPDEINIGSRIGKGNYKAYGDTQGGIPLAYRSCPGIHMALKALMGKSEASASLGGVILIKYSGAEDSCKLELSASGKTITSKVGDLGAEAVDTNFGTAGVIDLTATGFDTVGELVAAIDGYADYSCAKLMGADTATVVSVIETINFQAKNKYCIVGLTKVGTGAYVKRFHPELTETELPTLSIQKDGFQENYLYAGNAVKELTLEAAIREAVKGLMTCLGMTETAGQTESALAIPENDPWIFGGGLTIVDGVVIDRTNTHKITISNNHNEEGYGQASLERSYHEKGRLEVKVEHTAKLDAVSILEREKVGNCTILSLLFYYRGGMLGAAANELYEGCIIELPFMQNEKFEFPDKNDMILAKINSVLVNPPSGSYDSAMNIWYFSDEAAAL